MKMCLVNFGNVINSTGGAEKVLCDFANEMVRRGHNVVVVCSELKSGRPFFHLDNEVLFYNLGLNVNGTLFVRILRKIFTIINFDYKWYFNNKSVEKRLADVLNSNNPDIVINFFPKDLPYIVRVKKNIPVIQMLHGSAKWFENNISITIKNYLKQVEVLQVLLPSYAKELSYMNVKKICCIPNVVTKREARVTYSKKIVYLARYDVDKQIHLLVDAFAKCAEEFVDWEVHIYGTDWTRGYRDKVLKQIKEYKLNNQIFCHNRTNAPYEVLADSSICAFPSKYEGFPLALTEAMSIGLPCIGFASCTGVNEIIEDEKNGFLVDDVEGFADKLRILMNNPELCVKLGENGKCKMKLYEDKVVYDKWEMLLKTLYV